MLAILVQYGTERSTREIMVDAVPAVGSSLFVQVLDDNENVVFRLDGVVASVGHTHVLRPAKNKLNWPRHTATTVVILSDETVWRSEQ